jgi:hypothetical protein
MLGYSCEELNKPALTESAQQDAQSGASRTAPDGSISLGRCIGQRRSVRNFRDQALTKEELAQLLWAAQGDRT